MYACICIFYINCMHYFNQGAVFFVDKSMTKAILIPMESDDVKRVPVGDIRDLAKVRPIDGFRCYFLENSEAVVSRSLSINSDSQSGHKRGRDQIEAESEYNKLRRIQSERHLSSIFHLRNLNNWIKVALISDGLALLQSHSQTVSRTSNRPSRMIKLLDLACGKGGDLAKWLKCSTGVKEYIGVDIAQNSLSDFVERLKTRPLDDQRKISKLICADLGSDSLLSSTLETCSLSQINTNQHQRSSLSDLYCWQKIIPLQANDRGTFDVVSCQFALHYMFESYSRADHFFQEV